MCLPACMHARPSKPPSANAPSPQPASPGLTALVVDVAVLVDGGAQQRVQLVVLDVDRQAGAVSVGQLGDRADGLRTRTRTHTPSCSPARQSLARGALSWGWVFFGACIAALLFAAPFLSRRPSAGPLHTPCRPPPPPSGPLRPRPVRCVACRHAPQMLIRNLMPFATIWGWARDETTAMASLRI